MTLQEEYRAFCADRDETLLYGEPYLFARGDGLRVWLEGDETPFLDLVCGYSALNFGHCHPRLLARLQALASRVDHLHALASPEKVALSRRLVERCVGGRDYQVYFGVGGANAIEAAIKLARARTGRRKVLCFEGAFHGLGLGALAATDPAFVAADRLGVSGADVIRLPYCSPSLCAGGGAGPCRRGCLAALEAALGAGTGDLAAVLVEPVQGAAGFRLPSAGFLARLRELARAHGVPLIADEVQVGLGRTGMFLAGEHFGLTDPDILVLGKSLAGGYYPLSAVIARRPFFEALPPGRSGLGCTFSNSVLGCGLGLEAMDLLEEERLLENAKAMGARLAERLAAWPQAYPFVREVSALGLALAVEIAPPDGGSGGRELARAFVAEAFRRHLLVYACGVSGNRIKLAPPLIVTAAELDETVDRLEATARALAAP